MFPKGIFLNEFKTQIVLFGLITKHSLERSLSYSQDISILQVFECNTTSEWLNHTVKPIRSRVTFQFANLKEKDKGCS